MVDTRAVRDVIAHVVGAVDAAAGHDEPFRYLTFADVFPADTYSEMLRCMPNARDYRALPGRNKENLKDDGSSTRVKIGLFPEYIRHLPAEKRPVWDVVGRALCSDEVQAAFVRQLAPGMRRRFGDGYADVGMYAIPVLTRDTAGYRIPPHTDTHWKGITVQLYLPPDDAHANIGTIMNARDADGQFAVAHRMRFVPNSGYAFAVNDISWHSADAVGPEVKTRDSILLTYFVDSGLMRFLRNRAKRVGNLVVNEVRNLTR
jgi:hypothetical protein